MRLMLVCLLAAGVVACGKDSPVTPSTPPAPTPKTYTVAGFVHAAPDGAPLGNVYLRFFDTATGAVKGATNTTANGHYAIAIKEGSTDIWAEFTGWITSRTTRVITADTNVDFNLSLAPPVVEYRITGTARRCSATYANATGGTNQSVVSIPFSYTWARANTGDFLYLSCQIDSSGDTGSITVGIYKDGALYRSGFASGFPNIATASGSY